MSYLGVPPFGQTVRTVTTQTANGSQSVFYPTGGYTVGYLDVFYNGVRVVEATDYTAGDGNSVTFAAAPTSNAVIEMVSYGPISFVDAVARSGDTLGGTFYVRDLIPAANNTYSLGNSSYRFANLYLSGNTIVLGNSTISANATSVSFANSTGGAADVVLPNTGVVANTYGHSTAIPVVTIDAQGRVTTVTLANTLPHHDTAYSNAVSVANTTSFNQAANAYANAVSYTDAKVANLVNAAPATLDTLNELAAALGNDASFATTVTTGISAAYTNATTFAANASNITGGTLATARLPATANVSTAINIGANVSLTTSAINIGNSTVNLSITSTGITGTQFVNGAVTFANSSANTIYLTSNGNMSIGTNFINARLALESDTGLIARFNSTNTTLGSYMVWQTGNTTIADIGTTGQCFGDGSGANSFAINARGLRYFAIGTNNTERARYTSVGNHLLGTTTDYGARLSVVGSSITGGTLVRMGDQYTYRMNGYNSQVGNAGRTLFAYGYDQANWSYHYIKVIVKRGYYYDSGFAEYMINCQNGTVSQISATGTSTSTSSFTLSNNTINSNYRITTVSFISAAAYVTWDFEIEFWGMIPNAWTTTPAVGYIALN